jgi:hypothetical protein
MANKHTSQSIKEECNYIEMKMFKEENHKALKKALGCA